jgi:hypothetical protein
MFASPIFTPGTETSGGIRDSRKESTIARATETERDVNFFKFISISLPSPLATAQIINEF